MSRIVLTGSASGIGAATRQHLESQAHEVIGIDLREAEICSDLATADGRRTALRRVLDLSRGQIDGLVVCAGVGPDFHSNSTIVSLNYFGAVEILAGLRECLSAGRHPAAVAVSSNSATLPGSDSDLVEACLRQDENEARRLAETMIGPQVYGGSKLALARWVRRQATTAEWAGSRIRLNAVAPGAISTPLLQRGLDHPLFGPAIRNFPIPTGSFGSPDQIATAIAFLLGPQSTFCCGSVLFVDGGTDALLRPDQL